MPKWSDIQIIKSNNSTDIIVDVLKKILNITDDKATEDKKMDCILMYEKGYETDLLEVKKLRKKIDEILNLNISKDITDIFSITKRTENGTMCGIVWLALGEYEKDKWIGAYSSVDF
jgi:hypothetical protein